MNKLLLISLVFLLCACQNTKTNYFHNQGKAQGTYYSAIYRNPQNKDLQSEIEKFFAEFDASLSTYNPNSTISKINQNKDSLQTDSVFETMFYAAQAISEQTNGAFDITVAPLVNAWGFGFGTHERAAIPNIDSLLVLTGYTKVKIENHRVVKQNPAIMLDASAIAQGLSADMAARLLERHGCTDYMFDIGGEIVCRGVNPHGKKWRIGIDKPIDDATNADRQLQSIMHVNAAALTTSGNYRQFYVRDGKKYAHTINPKNGYPVEHNLLSATVVAPNCTLADAYATALMVMGRDSALAFCRRLPDIDCYLIYADSAGNYLTEMTEGFEKYLEE